MVTVVGHEPRFDEARKLLYCDLQLDAGPSYFLFVRLALARYQPHSIPGQHLSAVVFLEFAQLVAERTAALTRVGRSAEGRLAARAGRLHRERRRLAPFSSPTQRLSLSPFAVARVERLPAGSATDLAWVPAGDEVRLELSATGGLGDVRHFGTVPLRARQPGDQLRLALREYEILRDRRVRGR